jgi:hypothetical protein
MPTGPPATIAVLKWRQGATLGIVKNMANQLDAWTRLRPTKDQYEAFTKHICRAHS